MKTFTLRHMKAIQRRDVVVSLSTRLRQRLWQTLLEFNDTTGYTLPDNPNWIHNSTTLDDTHWLLKKYLGYINLQVRNQATQLNDDVDLEGFFLRSYPSNAFDVIEVWITQLESKRQNDLAEEVNSAFEAMNSPWRVVDGQFYKFDPEYFETVTFDASFDLMKNAGFGGPLLEFKRALEDLEENEIRDAISNASHSFESVLKAISGRNSGVSKSLLQDLRKSDFFDDLGEGHTKAVVSSLSCLSILANDLGRHGQGKDVVTIPKAYGELAVGLAATINNFLLKRHLEKTIGENLGHAEQPENGESPFPDKAPDIDDDIPF